MQLKESRSCSVHFVSLMPNRWLNHLPICCDAVVPLGDRTSLQSVTS